MNSKKYIIRQLIKDLMPIYPLYLLYFENKGLSVQQISVLLAIWSLPVILLELPTGVMADHWSRRMMITLGSLCKASCYFVWILADSFELFALGFILWGTGEAFTSGAEEALLFDSLKREGSEADFEAYLGKGRFLSGIGNILAAISGGFIGTFLGITWALYHSVATGLIAAGIAFLYKEVNYYRERTLEEKEKKETLKEALTFILRKKEILVFSLLAILVIGMSGILDEYDSLIAKDYGLSITGIGIWSAIRFLLIALGCYLAHPLRKLVERTLKKKDCFRILCIFSITAAVSLAVSGLLRTIKVMGLYGMYYMIMAAADVIQEDFIQQKIEEEGRSTVHSILSLAMNLFGFLCFGVLSLILKLSDLHGMLVFIAGYTLMLTLLLTISFTRIKKGTIKLK